MEASRDGANRIRKVVTGLNDQGWATTALSIALESGLAEALGEPRTAEALASTAGLSPSLTQSTLDLLVALEIADADGDTYSAPALAAAAGSPLADALKSELAGGLVQAAEVARRARSKDFRTGWTHTDPEVLRSQGVMSAGAVDMLEKQLFPSLPGMNERLEADTAAFLDVGAGVAAVSIEMCRRFPSLHVVGLEPQEAPLVIARGEVAQAGLEDRIELRQQLVQDLDEEEAFDFAWLPATFMPADVVEEGLRRVHRSLRHGGWMATGVLGDTSEGMVAAAARLRAVLWGGEALDIQGFRSMVESAGFGEIRLAPSSPAGFTPLVAQRPDS